MSKRDKNSNSLEPANDENSENQNRPKSKGEKYSRTHGKIEKNKKRISV